MAGAWRAMGFAFLAISFGSKGFSNSNSDWTQKLPEVIPGVQPQDIHYGYGRGRIQSNSSQKFTYYLTISDDGTPTGYAIPLATSRETGAVPEVVEVELASERVKKVPTQNFILDLLKRRAGRDGSIAIYRGAERDDELQSWSNSTYAPYTRYWTPNPNYAWRYARRNPRFMDWLANGRSGVYVFIPNLRSLESKVRSGQVSLGAELPKRVHENFQRTNRFNDHLAEDFAYLGDPSWGVEFEILAPPSGRTLFVHSFQRELSVQDLLMERESQIRKAYERLTKIDPSNQPRYQTELKNRMQKLQDEARFWKELGDGMVLPVSFSQPEIGYSDGSSLNDFASQNCKKRIQEAVGQ